ncbi:MAG: peptidoglycan D,D-transpeptidase FtsI family protein, partial [Fibrobacterota bacterium]
MSYMRRKSRETDFGSPLRIKFVGLFMAAAAVVFCFKLFYVAVVDGSSYRKAGDSQSNRRITLPPERGILRDTKGRALSFNTGMPLNELDKSGYSVYQRCYPFAEAVAALTGFVGKDGEGLAGLEYKLDEFLRGEKGWALVRRDAQHRYYPDLHNPKKAPVNGCDIELTIDMDIQKIAVRELAEGVRATGASGGIAVVADPVTGDILASAQYPSYDPNRFGNYESGLWRIDLVNMTYEPGSTFKLVAAAAALEECVFTEDELFDVSSGSYEIYGERIHDSHRFDHHINFHEGLVHSSNVFFAKLAVRIGKERMYRYSKDFGFDTKSGITLPGEMPGVVHPLEQWSGRTLVTMAMGHELTVTPLQLVA